MEKRISARALTSPLPLVSANLGDENLILTMMDKVWVYECRETVSMVIVTKKVCPKVVLSSLAVGSTILVKKYRCAWYPYKGIRYYEVSRFIKI